VTKAILNAIAVRSLLVLATLCPFVLPANSAHSQDFEHRDSLKAELIPFNQIPSVLANSHGRFVAQMNQDGSISYELSYADMSSPVTQAHIHFGASRTNGGVIVLLCGGPRPACPASGTVTGTITSADVSVLPVSNADSVIPQGIQPGNFSGLVDAIRSGNAYVNVHSQTFPSGEIRGQIQVW
jgi:hypothetical protein